MYPSPTKSCRTRTAKKIPHARDEVPWKAAPNGWENGHFFHVKIYGCNHMFQRDRSSITAPNISQEVFTEAPSALCPSAGDWCDRSSTSCAALRRSTPFAAVVGVQSFGWHAVEHTGVRLREMEMLHLLLSISAREPQLSFAQVCQASRASFEL